MKDLKNKSSLFKAYSVNLEKEIEKWFTLPDENEVEKLGDSNDRIINDIIGAAP